MDEQDEKRQRIIEARMKLRARYLEQMARTPSVSDERPQGSGPPNRHGMPRLPPRQQEARNWPVLDLGIPFELFEVPREAWRLTVDGAVEAPVELTWEDFLALTQHEDTSDFHCVTGWSRMDLRWVGVQLATVAALARPLPEARFLVCHSYDGYTANLPLEEALKADVLLAHTVDGEPLAREHGGPMRLITPQLYAWKGAKWLRRLEFLTEDRPGFWEVRGYSNTAHPWRDDRYSPKTEHEDS